MGLQSFRCFRCDTSWPYDFAVFHKCPECRRRTSYSMTAPISESEANHRRFDVFYRDLEEQRSKDRAEAIAHLDIPEPTTTTTTGGA